MQRSASPRDIAAYEGLVYKTSEMFAAMVGLEREDMQQELRIKVFQARAAYDPSRSKMSERTFVFSAISNLVKDMKKYAARRASLRIEHIEDHRKSDDNAFDRNYVDQAFELRYLSVTEDEAFAVLATFTMPSGVTEDEVSMIVMTMMGFGQQEIAEALGLSVTQVQASFRRLRDKLADWRPGTSGSDDPATPRPARSRPPAQAPQAPAPLPRAPAAVAA